MAPKGEVPVLKHGEKVIVGSIEIAKYANDSKAEPALIPAAHKARVDKLVALGMAIETDKLVYGHFINTNPGTCPDRLDRPGRRRALSSAATSIVQAFAFGMATVAPLRHLRRPQAGGTRRLSAALCPGQRTGRCAHYPCLVCSCQEPAAPRSAQEDQEADGAEGEQPIHASTRAAQEGHSFSILRACAVLLVLYHEISCATAFSAHGAGLHMMRV